METLKYKLYPCPYSIAVRCTLIDPCLVCETWGRFKAGEETPRFRSQEAEQDKPVEPTEGKLSAEEILKNHAKLFQEHPFDEMYYKDKDAILICMEAYHAQFEDKVSKKRKGYYCSICHDNPVDAENGYDTCQECLSKQ